MSGPRNCPFCKSADSRPYGRRLGHLFLRCDSCRSIHRDLTPEEFEELHALAFEADEFLDRIIDAQGLEPNTRLWRELDLPGRSILEIGPGAGHLLAAAKQTGRDTYGIETSKRHRDFIDASWGIQTVPSFDDLPIGLRVDLVVCINVLEHVFDLDMFLAQVRDRLAPGGQVYISTVNAGAWVARLVGPMWSMFKEPDHVSFPSAKGLRIAAQRSGLSAQRLWSAEMPFETFVSLLVAARDWGRERSRTTIPHSESDVSAIEADSDLLPQRTEATRSLNRLLDKMNRSAVGRYEPTSAIAGWFKGAGTVKAVLIR